MSELDDNDPLFGEAVEWERLSGRPKSEFSRDGLLRLQRGERRRRYGPGERMFMLLFLAGLIVAAAMVIAP